MPILQNLIHRPWQLYHNSCLANNKLLPYFKDIKILNMYFIIHEILIIIVITIKILGYLHITLSPWMLMTILYGRYYYPLFTSGGPRAPQWKYFAQGHTSKQWQSWDSKSSVSNVKAHSLNHLLWLCSRLEKMREHSALREFLMIWLVPLVPSWNSQWLPPQF